VSRQASSTSGTQAQMAVVVNPPHAVVGHGSGHTIGLGSREVRHGRDAISLKPGVGSSKMAIGSGTGGAIRGVKDRVVLSVDDDHVSQEVISATVSNCFEVVKSMSGDECLEYMKTCQKRPDIILLDVMMPGMNGLDVLAELRKRYSMLELPIIMVSAKNSMTDVVRGLALQCNDWVHKPFDKSELLARVKMCTGVRDLMEKCKADIIKELASQAVPAGPVSQAVPLVAPTRAQESKSTAESLEEKKRLESSIKSLESESRQLKHLLNVANMDKETLQADVNKTRAEFDKARSLVESLKDQEAQRESELRQLQAQVSQRHQQQQQQQQQQQDQQQNQRQSQQSARQPPHAKPASVAQESWQAPGSSSEDKILLQRLLYQNAHLTVEVKGRERMLHECQEQLQRAKMRLQTAELRCEQLNQAMVRLEVDNSFFNRPVCGGIPGMNSFS